MAPPRQRSPGKKDYPENLYDEDGYFYYRNRLDGKRYPLGRISKADAFRQARAANAYVAQRLGENGLVEQITGAVRGFTLSDWIDEFLPKLEERIDDGKIKRATYKAWKAKYETVRGKLGKIVLTEVSTKDVADFLREYEKAGKKRMAQAMRSRLMDLFSSAVAAGRLPKEKHPVEHTETVTVRVRRARLTLDVFMAIYEKVKETQPAWAARAMELAIVTGQRREDIRAMEFRPREKSTAWIADDRLWVHIQKTGVHLRLPLHLRLQAVNWSIGEVVQRCRDNAVSKHLVHHVKHVGQAKPGSQVRIQSISAAFAEARDAVFPDPEKTWPGRTPPTFHEIRSLSARLYDAQGVNAQALLGHKSADMTNIYRDVRGADWIEVTG